MDPLISNVYQIKLQVTRPQYINNDTHLALLEYIEIVTYTTN